MTTLRLLLASFLVSSFAFAKYDRPPKVLRPGKMASDFPRPDSLCQKLECPAGAKPLPAPQRKISAVDPAETAGCFRGKVPHGPAVSCVGGKVRDYDEFAEGFLEGYRRKWNDAGRLVSERLYKKGVQQVLRREDWARWEIDLFDVQLEAPFDQQISVEDRSLVAHVDELRLGIVPVKGAKGADIDIPLIAKEMCDQRFSHVGCKPKCVGAKTRPLDKTANGGKILELSVREKCPGQKARTSTEEAFVGWMSAKYLMSVPAAKRFDDVELEVLRSLRAEK